ncbi:hypothetical protein SAMN00120144_0830 [Hymenobacter roseosalivarius DSM 11622]|uniref:STAS/SEC14 domain-containing protein n=1 Tax=Hymenobacter roseosalivarius DSM 11622 TaxID=645990 RepID=A0A1W1UU03_9BACT|nr:hypothetical protein [Hymenobacter roseosalivarius]SMB84291.1 hypothetical protein SAMN00120144_0830 [Hymenobacter roseosalivarius DSM 11622]
MAAEKLPELLQTNYRSDLNLFVGRWGYQPASELLSRTYEQLTQRALECGCRFWLQDIRRRAFNDPDITRWLLTSYFPQMATSLGGRLHVAYLTSPTLLETIVNGSGYVLPGAYENSPFVIAFFSTENNAMEWLHQAQGRELLTS